MPRLSLAKLERHLYSAADRLRQEGLDAATYKDYIFGLLFLKRSSDIFDAERERIVGRKVEQGMVQDVAEAEYGENPDFYDTFFVPKRARWSYLQARLADAMESFGAVLDKALGALSEHEVEAQRELCEALGFNPAHAFARRENDKADLDFAPMLTERATIRPLVENDAGVQARAQALHEALTVWWIAHAPRLVELPMHRCLNVVCGEFLETFVAALAPLNALDRFKLAGVIAAWWTDTLPDFKTLLENRFPGVIDGWVDAIADAVDDDDNAGPAFDPFGHKLVRRIMADYLERIAAACTDIARFKGEKEVREQSNAPDDLEEEELAGWNYARDLERQIKELKADNREALKELARLEKAAARIRATFFYRQDATEVRARLRPVLDQIAQLEAALVPYEQIKTDLTAARARYRELINRFVEELKFRCSVLGDEQKESLVLELFAQDVQSALESAVSERRQALVRFIEGLWDKYAVTLSMITLNRERLQRSIITMPGKLGYQ